MEGPMSAFLQEQPPPLLQTLVNFHTRFCSNSPPSPLMAPHVSGSIPNHCPQPMDLDDLPTPITILQTLPSNPNSNTIPFMAEPEEEEDGQTLVMRDAILPGRGEIRTRDIENPASLEADMAVDMASIFRLWDLNTERPELEEGTLTEVLRALRENRGFDGGQGFVSEGPATDAFDLREMRVALEEQMVERPPVDISVSALVRLLRSVL